MKFHEFAVIFPFFLYIFYLPEEILAKCQVLLHCFIPFDIITDADKTSCLNFLLFQSQKEQKENKKKKNENFFFAYKKFKYKIKRKWLPSDQEFIERKMAV